jgi:hypothetical protein
MAKSTVSKDSDSNFFSMSDLVGMNLKEGQAKAKSAGFSVRTTMRDGKSLIVTADYRTNRINVSVEGDKIVAVRGIG